MRVITAHQPNFLPGINVLEKIEAADVVLWLDEVQFTKGGFTNRNRMPDGSWLTVPLLHPLMVPIKQVRIDNTSDWRRKHSRTILQHYGEYAQPICDAIEKPCPYLITLNMRLLMMLLWHVETIPYMQSEVRVSSGDSISEQLAAMVYALDGDVYLSGPSGRDYLDEAPFSERGLEVRYAEPTAVNECALSRFVDRTVEA